MLKAILSGKAGKIVSSDSNATSWRSIYRESEDLLTASVFGRLPYLSQGCLQKVLLTAASPNTLPPQLGTLNETEFWPSLIDVTKPDGTVEPDAIFRFNNAILIIEAKRYDESGHYAEQWAREWCAVYSSENSDTAYPMHLVAVGGISQYNPSTLSAIKSEAERQIAEINIAAPSIEVSSVSWAKLANVIDGMLKENEKSLSSDKLILSDIRDALALHGFRTLAWITDILGINPSYCDIYDNTSISIFYEKRKKKSKIFGLVNFKEDSTLFPNITMTLWNEKEM